MSRSADKTMLQDLASQPVFAKCSRKELQAVARLGTKIVIDAGYVLTREGRRGYEFFVIVEGTATCSIDGQEVARLGPGDFFGEMALLDGGTRSATVVADSPMQVLVIDSREFGGMIDEAPATSRVIMQSLASRLRSAQEQAPA